MKELTMKKRFTIHGILSGVLLLGLLLTQHTFGQSALQFTGISATDEGAIRLTWISQPNEVYEIDEADALIDTNTGSITWNKLYGDYPSQGTNTFWLDTGNYNLVPPILHPKNVPMRFYRIVDEGADTTSDEPTVSIVSPANNYGASGELSISVVAATDQPVLSGTKLYVDGQEMQMADSTTNYVNGSTNYEADTYSINTCEWGNGSHILFATATARSGLSGPSGNFPIYTGHAVSTYVPVTFSNLISRTAFSQPFFEPSLGQTQEVTATFAANCDWTLQIVDESSNAVRTVTGSGNSMTFDWDGTGDGGTNIPDGVYYYLIAAQTNGLSNQISGGGSGASGDGGSPPAPAFASSLFANSDSTELWATPANGSGHAVPLAIYPPGFDTNGLVIFAASQSEMQARNLSFSSTESFNAGSVGPDYAGPSAQSTTVPMRPPTGPVKNAVNNYAIGYYSFPNPRTVSIPQNGIPYPTTGVCHLDGSNRSQISLDNIPEADMTAVNMIQTMKKKGWKLAFEKADQDLPVNSIRRSDQGYGGSEIFTQATIGLFMGHGDYGTDPDYSAGASGSEQTYFCSSNPNDSGNNVWLRMCQFGFGGNLKWMAILACNSICDPNYSSMLSAGGIPLKTTHLLCGTDSISWMEENIGANWAINMIGKNQQIVNAWFNAAHDAYKEAQPGVITNTVTFRVAGYPECMTDTVVTNTAPSNPSSAPGNLVEQHQQVYP